LLECETYRFKGHSKSDPRKYRSREEEEAWRQRCPIETLRKRILKDCILDEERVIKLEDEVRTEVDEAYTFGMNSDVLSNDRLFEDIYHA